MEPLRVGIREFREKLASYVLESDTPLVASLNDDDLWEPQFLERIAPVMLSCGAITLPPSGTPSAGSACPCHRGPRGR